MPDAYSLFDLVQAQNYLSIDVHNGQVCPIMFFLPSVFLQYWRNDHKNARPLFCDVQPSSLITSTKKFFVVWLVNTGIRTGAYYRDRTDYRLAGTSDYERTTSSAMVRSHCSRQSAALPRKCIIGTARIVCGARSMKRYGVRLSVPAWACCSKPAAADLLLRARKAEVIDRLLQQRRAAG